MTRYYAYVILCDDGSLYKGHTNNINKRYKEHCRGVGARHTKAHKPVKILYHEKFESLENAVAREKYLKSGVGRKFLKEILNNE